MQRVAGVLSRCVRSQDTVARLGEDEFALLLEHCNMEQAQQVALKICTHRPCRGDT
jgi:diguanylate cyclase